MTKFKFGGGGINDFTTPGFIRTNTGNTVLRLQRVAQTASTPSTSTAGAPLPSTPALVPNSASYYGLNIPVSMGKRAIVGVPIFAGAVRIEGNKRFIDVAFSFGEPMVPEAELIDTKLTKLWIAGELVESQNLNEGWNTSNTLNYILYTGSEEQLPDPRIKKWLTEERTPAFRGLTYIVFYDFPLHLYSSDFTIPTVRAELVDLVENVVQVEEFGVTGGPDKIYSNQIIIPNFERNHVYLFEKLNNPDRWFSTVVDLTSNTEIAFNQILYSDGSNPVQLQLTSSTDGGGILEPSTGFVITQRLNTNQRPMIIFDPYSGLIIDELGDGGNNLADQPDDPQAHVYRAAVSTSNTMSDRLICTAGAFSDTIGFWRISPTGELSTAFIDVDEVLGNDDAGFGGNVIDIITGDKISGTNKGFGTVLVAHRKAIYRITIQAETVGDGNPLDVVTDNIPLHLPPATNPYGGVFSQAYTDIEKLHDVTTGGEVDPSAADLLTGQPTITFDLSDAGDLTSATLNNRVMAYIKYTSIREFRQFFINTRALDANDPDGIVDYDVVVSDNGSSWTLVSASNISNTDNGVMLGSNADAAKKTATRASYNMSGESFYSGNPLSPLPSGKYVGFALKQANYTVGSVTSFTPWAGGRDGLEVNDAGLIDYPDLLVPHMVELWSPPTGHSIQMMFLDPKSEDVIVLFSEDPDSSSSTPQFIARLEMNSDILGFPTPVDPAGAGTTQKYVVPFARKVDNWALLRNSWNNSDITSNTLGVASSSGGDTPQSSINVINLATGSQKLTDFGSAWRDFGAGSNDPESLDMQQRQLWVGSGSYLVSQWADDFAPVGFGMSRILPFQTEVSGYPLADVLRWMSLRVGYLASEIDTSSVTDTVIGAILLERVSFRDLMSNLGAIYDFDVFESEGKIKFVKAGRGGSFSIDYVLTANDLSPINGGEGLESEEPDASVSRPTNNDLPNSLELKYLDITADYTVNTAFARRTRFPVNTTGNIDVAPAQYAVPIVMTPSEALLRSSRLLYRQWSDQSVMEFRVPTAQLTMEPADVVSLPVDGVSYQVKNIETIINADHSVSVTGQTVSADEIDEVTAETPIQLAQDVSGPSASDLFFLDIPALTSADVTSQVGVGLMFYTAVTSKGQGAWDSGTLYVKESGPAFTPVYTNAVSSRASGFALTTIPKGVESTIDIDSDLQVLLLDSDATFATITYQQILDGGNLAAYGAPGRWEIVQVQTVINVSGDIFSLTNIVRGLYGTEVFSGMHISGDQFVLLDRPPVQLNNFAGFEQLNSTILMKAVGQRQDEPDITPEQFTMSAAFSRMLSPTNLTATLVSTDIVFTWDRRTRLENVWVDSLETVPTESTASTFELEVYANLSDTTPLRTFTELTEPTVTYENADILTDHTEVPDTVFIRVYHLSTEVGRSLPEQKELDVL